jgi:hypothetical protein
VKHSRAHRCSPRERSTRPKHPSASREELEFAQGHGVLMMEEGERSIGLVWPTHIRPCDPWDEITLPMDNRKAHFLVLPERRGELWLRMSGFLEAWSKAAEAGRRVHAAELVNAESALGLGFPLALREFYAEFGGWIDAGYLNDGYNSLLRPRQCHLTGNGSGETLVIGDEYFGALWGVRREDVVQDDPLVRCIDPGGEPTDDLFSVTGRSSLACSSAPRSQEPLFTFG